MLEIYVLYNKITGFIVGGGRLNRELDVETLDGSTSTDMVERFLAKDVDNGVVYFPNQRLPKRTEYKVNNGELVALTTTEVEAEGKPRLDEIKIAEEMETITRATAIQNLKDRGELVGSYEEITRS